MKIELYKSISGSGQWIVIDGVFKYGNDNWEPLLYQEYTHSKDLDIYVKKVKNITQIELEALLFLDLL